MQAIYLFYFKGNLNEKEYKEFILNNLHAIRSIAPYALPGDFILKKNNKISSFISDYDICL